MNESDFIDRVNECERLADLERLMYQRANGRVSRSDCKALVGKMVALNRIEAKSDRQQFMANLLEVKRQFFEVIAR